MPKRRDRALSLSIGRVGCIGCSLGSFSNIFALEKMGVDDGSGGPWRDKAKRTEGLVSGGLFVRVTAQLVGNLFW